MAVSSVLVSCFGACGNLKMMPLTKTAGSYDCYGEPDNGGTIYAPIEEQLMRQGALKSRKINLESGIGMMEKTARLFILDNNDVRVVFHFMHPVDLEIGHFGFVLQGDSGVLASGEMQVDYRATIGGMTEEHAYIILPAEKVARLLEDRNVSILVEDLVFDIPFRCRETFREIGNKHGTR
jgi:hypothetical protein